MSLVRNHRIDSTIGVLMMIHVHALGSELSLH
jgi:hypothetical protein